MPFNTRAREHQTAASAFFILLVASLCRCLPALAQDASAEVAAPAPAGNPAPADDPASDRWAIHGQTTYTQQFQPAFHSTYQGPQSLSSAANGRETFDFTVFGGFRPWDGGEIWIDPEIDQGYGLADSYGLAGYLSGEAYKLGATYPYYRMARGFFRQTINLGGDTVAVDAGLNQFAGTQTANRIVLTIGKLSVVDIFDTNKYAHDPRGDFLNWAVLDVGTFDYAADAWGTTYGAAAEWYQGDYALRAGLFDLSSVPNSVHLAIPLLQQTQFVAEAEERHTLFDQPGAVRFLYWLTRGNLGTYTNALTLAAATGTTPSTAAVRTYRSKFGVALNIEQQLAPDLGMFAKAGWTQPDVEETDYTDISESVAIGLSMKGSRWNRPDDTVGLAAVVNQISHSGKLYLAAGGLGGIIGDGRLPQAGPEQILETFYSFAPMSFGKVTADYQFVNNPAYNRQRGPVSALALRLHAEF